LFARLNNELVEIVVDRVPEDRAALYVRRPRDLQPTTARVDALTLVGFLPSSAA
jgi:hypothetical protein